MTGDELRAAREQLGVLPADLAVRAGVAPDVLAQWEKAAAPRAVAYKLECALWELERDAALAKAGLPPCDWVARFAALPAGPRKDLRLLEQHIGGCGACKARGRFVAEHVRPRPENPWLAWLPPLPRAVMGGALLALVVSGGVVAALILLILGLAGQDANLLVGSAGVFLGCAAAGGVGGAVHHLTQHMLPRGAVGHYTSWILAVEAALFIAVTLIAFAARLQAAGLGADEFHAVTHPLVLAALIAAGVLIALAVGFRMRG